MFEMLGTLLSFAPMLTGLIPGLGGLSAIGFSIFKLGFKFTPYVYIGIALIILGGVAYHFGSMYYLQRQLTQAERDNAILKENQIKLENAVKQQEETLSLMRETAQRNLDEIARLKQKDEANAAQLQELNEKLKEQVKTVVRVVRVPKTNPAESAAEADDLMQAINAQLKCRTLNYGRRGGSCVNGQWQSLAP